MGILTTALCFGLALGSHSVEAAQSSGQRAPAPDPQAAQRVESGNTLFQQRCAFCHGRDAMGGETGPDLTRSKLVLADVAGDKIGDVVRNGRAPRMPPFPTTTDAELTDLAAFIHAQQLIAQTSGKRKGVDVADLQTGNVQAGRQYFEGAGGCAKCHSATGDLAHIAAKYQGLQLEEHMLYPRDAKGRATVTMPSGQAFTGTVEYQDEFTLGIRLPDGTYRSFPIDGPTDRVKYKIDAPHLAHVELFSKYTDDDIHNLMAYLQTLR
jgi:cytochrome c oxidase cbb3-type subunit III